MFAHHVLRQVWFQRVGLAADCAGVHLASRCAWTGASPARLCPSAPGDSCGPGRVYLCRAAARGTAGSSCVEVFSHPGSAHLGVHTCGRAAGVRGLREGLLTEVTPLGLVPE